MERQLPLPPDVLPAVNHTQPLAPEHAVLVFKGLFPSSSEPGLPLAIRNTRITEAVVYKARLRLQFFYGARQIIKQVLCEFAEGGEYPCSVYAALFPPELHDASGTDVLYMEVNYLAFVMEWLRYLRPNVGPVNDRIAQHVHDEIYNRLYAYWPLPEFHPDRWRAGYNPLAKCREFAQEWLYGHRSQQRFDEMDPWSGGQCKRPFQVQLVEAMVDPRVPPDFHDLTFSSEQIA
jgi:hypothetical protein